MVGLRHIKCIVGPRPQQFPDKLFAHCVNGILRSGAELRQIECITVEGHNARVAFVRLGSLDAAAFHHQKRTLLILHDLALLGEVGGMLFRIAGVVDENAEQESIWTPVGNVEGEVAAHCRKSTRLHDVGQDVGAHLRRPSRAIRAG